MQRISVNGLCKFLILAALALTPLFNVFEVLALMKGTLTSQSRVLTPIYIKLVKDLVLLMIICLGGSSALLGRRVLSEKSFWLFVFSVLLSFCLSVFNQEYWLTLAGVRHLLPFAVLFSVYGITNDEFQGKLAKLLAILFVVGLTIQLFQLFCAVSWYEPNLWGLSRRNPGFYLIPSSMAMFSLITMYYLYHYYPSGVFRNLCVYMLGPLSVLLTASGTGIVSLGLFMFTIAYFRTRPKSIVILVCISLLLLILVFLPNLTGRDDVYVSLSMRLAKLSDVWTQNRQLLSTHFGYGTNAAVLLKNTYDIGPPPLITDSTFTAIIVSYGCLPLVFFILFIAEAVGFRVRMIQANFIVIFVTFMLTTQIFELFPANLLFSVNLAYFLKTKHNQVLRAGSVCVGINTAKRGLPKGAV
ncbi:MAG: hypothetical protein ACYST6_00355 [Planctomycetota bacterium]|jgi:hypothetical protein